MAILLVYDKDNTNPNSAKDQSGCYKKGNIVEVFEDGTKYVTPPQPPFLIIQVNGVTKSQVAQYMQRDMDKRRTFTVLIDSLTFKDRVCVTNLLGIKPYIENVKTGVKVG